MATSSDGLLNAGKPGHGGSPTRTLTMLPFRIFFKITWWFLTLSLVNPLYDILRQLGTVYFRLHPAPGNSPTINALRSEYGGLERLIDDRNTLISPLSRSMHLGSSMMEEIIAIVRSSSIDGADALARTLLQLSTDATDIGQDLQGYSASIDSTVDE